MYSKDEIKKMLSDNQFDKALGCLEEKFIDNKEAINIILGHKRELKALKGDSDKGLISREERGVQLNSLMMRILEFIDEQLAVEKDEIEVSSVPNIKEVGDVFMQYMMNITASGKEYSEKVIELSELMNNSNRVLHEKKITDEIINVYIAFLRKTSKRIKLMQEALKKSHLEQKKEFDRLVKNLKNIISYYDTYSLDYSIEDKQRIEHIIKFLEVTIKSKPVKKIEEQYKKLRSQKQEINRNFNKQSEILIGKGYHKLVKEAEGYRKSFTNHYDIFFEFNILEVTDLNILGRLKGEFLLILEEIKGKYT